MVRENRAAIEPSLSLKNGERAFFVYGYAKSDRDNIDPDELEAFKKAAKELLALTDEQIQQLTTSQGLTEITP